MFEAAIVISLVALAFSTLSSLWTRNHELAEDTRARQQAEGAHRKNMAALTRVFRGIDIQSLGGFDAEGESTKPEFARITGADMDDYTYVGEEHLTWMPSPIAVDGVINPGAVYLVRDGRRLLVADRVPKGGFSVRQLGQSLAVRLTTFYATSTSRLVSTSTESTISIRN